MLDKIKDFLYETSDLLLALVILLVMSSLITWQVTDSMAFSSNAGSFEPAAEVEFEEESPSEEIAENTEEDDTNTTVHSPVTSPETPPEESVAIEPVTVEPVNQNAIDVTPNVLITVEIPSGTPGVGIAKILREKGLIQDTSSFISRVEELNLAVKLKSGTFKINSNTSIDDMIYIITGQKR